MILDSLKWRYATKQFDATKKLSDTDLQLLLDAFLLTPTSFGLFPFELVMVTDPAVRATLMTHSWGQRQIVDASHLFVLARRTDVDAAYVRRFVERMSVVRNTDVASLKGYEDYMLGFISALSTEAIAVWSAKQAYIALWNLLTVAAELQIDACPMEGFSPADYDKVLDLTAKNLASVVVLTVGYRSAEDKYAHAPKVRWKESDVIIKM